VLKGLFTTLSIFCFVGFRCRLTQPTNQDFFRFGQGIAGNDLILCKYMIYNFYNA
jgi:hypothetical protein